MGGDFNTVLRAEERKGCGINQASMNYFNTFILRAKMIDIPLNGISFTWSNNRKHASCARLDRFPISPWILSWFPKISQSGLREVFQTIVQFLSDFIMTGWKMIFWAIRKDEQMWRQKSRIKWLKEGDKNSKFFHCIANNIRRNNYVGNMVIRGNRISNPIRIKNGIYDFFKNHFKNVPWKRPTISGLDLKVLAEVYRVALERPLNEDEGWAAVNGCDGNKAPVPNGLNLNFVKANWVSIKDDFMNFIEGFHKDGAIVKDINNTFIALIPK
ncbi:hypothetical protein Dsin_017206 [Dipteronia sinensis]|uniref:Uncharacterized protein n=1 Tax=Dipteronia sinensis TaxID=43782 RepID=A0AAE0AG06_9ROSI|nr:hypothetical protein Dsin_017206 [Dipteronia sinensis]